LDAVGVFYRCPPKPLVSVIDQPGLKLNMDVVAGSQFHRLLPGEEHLAVYGDLRLVGGIGISDPRQQFGVEPEAETMSGTGSFWLPMDVAFGVRIGDGVVVECGPTMWLSQEVVEIYRPLDALVDVVTAGGR
jgi:hypothetical protein